MNLANLQLTKQHKILIAIFFILIVYVDVSYILKAQLTGLNSLKPKISKLKIELANLNQGLENMRLAKGQSATALAQKKSLKSSRILSQSRVAELLQEISSLANKFNIQVVQLRPSRPAVKEKASGAGKDKPGPLLINLELVADYHNLGRFIQALEDSDVFMGVSELEISTQLPDYMKQKVTLVLKTYVTK
jgi:hypothetical protein